MRLFFAFVAIIASLMSCDLSVYALLSIETEAR